MEMNNYSRRQFVKAGSAISAGTLLASPHIANAQNSSKTLKVGLVGIGGRGSGAAAQAMAADDNVALTAIGDIFEDRIKLRSRILKARGRDKYQVTPETTFTGIDAYKKVIDSGVDVKLTRSVSIRLAANVVHETVVPVGLLRTDLRSTVGFSWKTPTKPSK